MIDIIIKIIIIILIIIAILIIIMSTNKIANRYMCAAFTA